MSAADVQPATRPTEGPAIWDLVIADSGHVLGYRDEEASFRAALVADMRARDKLGEQRYGTRLQASNGRDPLVDAYQEALDGLAYLRQAMSEAHPVRSLYDLQWRLVVEIKTALLGRSGSGEGA